STNSCPCSRHQPRRCMAKSVADAPVADAPVADAPVAEVRTPSLPPTGKSRSALLRSRCAPDVNESVSISIVRDGDVSLIVIKMHLLHGPFERAIAVDAARPPCLQAFQ